jgi:hypothetical protein
LLISGVVRILAAAMLAIPSIAFVLDHIIGRSGQKWTEDTKAIDDDESIEQGESSLSNHMIAMTSEKNRIAAVTLLAAVFIYAAMFMIPLEWQFGAFDHRSIQHAIGYCGISLLASGFLSGFSSRVAYAFYCVVSGLVIFAAWFCLSTRPPTSSSSHEDVVLALARNPGTIFFASYVFLAWAFRQARWESRRWAVIGTAICLVFSFWWEVIQQPMLGSYGKGPRHSFQIEQIEADFAGIVLGLGIYWYAVLRRRSESGQRIMPAAA